VKHGDREEQPRAQEEDMQRGLIQADRPQQQAEPSVREAPELVPGRHVQLQGERPQEHPVHGLTGDGEQGRQQDQASGEAHEQAEPTRGARLCAQLPDEDPGHGHGGDQEPERTDDERQQGREL